MQTQASPHSSEQWDQIRSAVEFALREDIGSGDITAELCDLAPTTARVICKDHGVLCGRDWFNEVFHQLSPDIRVNWLVEEGTELSPAQTVCEISGSARLLLSGERTALNFLQTLSGTATTTRQVLPLIPAGTRLLDTRKTLPCLRYAQKYAVRCGGGYNHRMGLFDAYLIKENHIAACGSITDAVSLAKQHHPSLPVEVEVETLDQLHEAVACKADIALLDNFDIAQIKQAIDTYRGEIKLEISGGIDQQQLQALGTLVPDYISMGALTKHVHALDFSMLIDHRQTD